MNLTCFNCFLQFVLLLSVCFSCVFAQAAAPTNDLCSGAIIIPEAGPFPHLTPVTADISACSTLNDPPFPSCAGSVSRSVWYRFIPSTTALYAFSVGSDTATTVPDTVMALYSAGASGGCGSALTEVVCNDDGGDLRSGLAASLTRNRTYFVVVWMLGEDPPEPGASAVQLRVTRPLAPANDLCSGSLVVPGNGPFPFVSPTNDILLAGTAGDPPLPVCASEVSSSTWYRFSPAVSGHYRISTCSPSSGSRVVDTLLALYSAPSCAGPFTEIACNDDSCGTQASLSASLKAGSNYFVVVWNFGGAGPLPGSSDLATRFALIGAPDVATLGASNVTATTADLYASLNPAEGVGLLGFEWGTTTNYGNWTDFQEVSGTTNWVVSSFHLEGLTPGTTYFFRASVTNETGIALGQNATFKTDGPPQITSITWLADNTRRIRFQGSSAAPYTVLGSPDLLDWVDLGVPQEISPGLFEFLDAAAPSPTHFYKIRSP